MFGLQDIETELPLTAFRRFDRTKLRDRDSVMGFFNEIPREIMRRHGEPGVADYGFCSTIMLLQAEKTGVVSWEQLSELIARKVNYPAIFEHVCGSIDLKLESYSQTGDAYEGFDLDFYLICLRCVPTSVFTRLIAALADVLRGARERSFLCADDALLGRSPDYWVNLERFTYNLPRDERPSVYMAHLWRNEAFASDAEGIFALLPQGVSIISTNFPGYRSPVAYGEGDVAKIVSGNQPLLEQLKDFLERWCLAGCRRESGDSRLVVFPRRVSVQVAPGNVGINVFIPRFYAFSHIKNLAGSDFGMLKLSMELIHESMKDGRISKEEQEIEARNIRRQLEDAGMEPGKAWDEARRRMQWAESTMESRIGLRPEGRTGSRRRTAGKAASGLEEHRVVNPGGED